MKVAFLVPTTSHDRDWKTIEETYLYKYFLQSLTLSTNYKYTVYLGVDHDDKLFNESYKFCIVRNPYERMVSTYFFRKLHKEKDFGPKKQWDLNFSDWIKYIYSNEYKNLNLKHRMYNNILTCLNYSKFISPYLFNFD
jgi:hypothetical protein